MIYEQTMVLSMPFDAALQAVKEAFASQGFGTLTEIDLQATLKQKIGRDMEPYIIVGACNPALAGRAIDAYPQIGVLLPCNVVVRETDDGVVVEAMDPGLMATLTDNSDIEPIANEARQLISNALSQLNQTTSET